MISAARAGRGISGAWRFDRPGRRQRCRVGASRLPATQFLARGLEQLLLRDHFIDQSELQRLLRGIKFSFQDDFGRRLRADQARQARRAAPRRHQTERRFRQTDRVAGSHRTRRGNRRPA